MFWQVFIPGFVLGIISSFHCVGMCGPLALSLPMAQFSPREKVLGILLYNIGRVATYSILGIIFGLFGRQIFIAGYQQGFSIAIGAVILFVFLLSLFRKKITSIRIADRVFKGVQSLVVRFLRLQTLGGLFVTGMANGLLPCGMVYLAITGAMATGNLWLGMEFMAAFGLGTMPLLLILTLAGFVIGIRARSFFRRLTPYAFLLMSVLLILRGLNLGIPFLSPSFTAVSTSVPCR
jgi:sulfite exporter TauE/SafE